MSEVTNRVLAMSQELEQRRKTLGLSQVELAGLAGVSPRFMYDLESGKETISLDRLLLVITALGLEIELKVASHE